MRRAAPHLAIVVSLALLTTAAPSLHAEPRGAGGGTGYALHIWPDTNELVTHALSAFEPNETLGTNTDVFGGIDFDPFGEVLYGLNQTTQEVGTISLEDGSFTAIGSSMPMVTGHNFWDGFTVDPLTGTAWATSYVDSDAQESALYTIDLETGEATLVGINELGWISGLAMDCDGTLWATDLETDSLYTVDPVTALATLVGPLGVNIGLAQEMDFDENGVLYAWLYERSDPDIGRYGTISVEDGTFTTIDTLGTDDQWVGAARADCLTIFEDGFESGDTSAWDPEVR